MTKTVEVLSIERAIAEIRANHDIEGDATESPDGPGSMQGKPLFFLYYHNLMMNGFQDGSITNEDGYVTDYFKIRPVEIEHIPGYKETMNAQPEQKYILLWTDTQGFWHFEFMSSVPEDFTSSEDEEPETALTYGELLQSLNELPAEYLNKEVKLYTRAKEPNLVRLENALYRASDKNGRLDEGYPFLQQIDE